MKKIILLFGILLVVFIAVVLFYGKISIRKVEDQLPLNESSFYKNYYNTEDILLINVWSISSKSIIEEFPQVEEIVNNHNVNLITVSTEEDTLKVKQYLSKNPLLKAKDITLQNYNVRDSIFDAIEFSDYEKGLFNAVNFSIKKTPYTVLIKNKEILFKSDDNLDVKKLEATIQSIKK